MMNDTKYIRLYEQELAYLPNDEYNTLANDLLAFYIKYNYISIADFISYEVESDAYELAIRVIDEFIQNTLSDEEIIDVVNKVKDLANERKIKELKEKLKTTTDINEKLRINDEIVNLKRGCVK